MIYLFGGWIVGASTATGLSGSAGPTSGVSRAFPGTGSSLSTPTLASSSLCSTATAAFASLGKESD